MVARTELGEVAAIEIRVLPRDASITSVSSERELGIGSTTVDPFEERGPFVIARKGFKTQTVQLFQLRPGENEFELTRVRQNAPDGGNELEPPPDDTRFPEWELE